MGLHAPKSPPRDVTFRFLLFPNYTGKSREDSGLRKKRGRKKEVKAWKVSVYPPRMEVSEGPCPMAPLQPHTYWLIAYYVYCLRSFLALGKPTVLPRLPSLRPQRHRTTSSLHVLFPKHRTRPLIWPHPGEGFRMSQVLPLESLLVWPWFVSALLCWEHEVYFTTFPKIPGAQKSRFPLFLFARDQLLPPNKIK